MSQTTRHPDMPQAHAHAVALQKRSYRHTYLLSSHFLQHMILQLNQYISYIEPRTYEDYLRAAHKNLMIGGDAFYCAGSVDTIAKLAAEGIPVVGHVGLIPARATWTGGFKAVGKTAAEAIQVYEHVKQLEAAGAVAAEIEVVPARVASEIAKRTTLVLMSMGAGSGCDAQYLFAEDVLGYSRGHQPRHAKVYRNFRAEYERLQRERVAAFQEFRADVEKGAYPEEKHLVPIADSEFDAFVKGL